MDQPAFLGASPGPSRSFPATAGDAMHLSAWEALAGSLIGGLLALGFAARLLPGGLAGVSWRLSCVGYALLCLARGSERRPAWALLAVFMPFLAAVTSECVVFQTASAVADLARQLFLIAFVAIVFGAARDPVARRVGLWALFVVAGAILADALVRTLPELTSGWSYAAARIVKGKSFQNGFNANELCFAALVALLAGFPDQLVPRRLALAMAALVGLCSVVLAARTPLLALAAGLAGGWLLARAPIWPACQRNRWRGAMVAGLDIGGLLAVFFGEIDAIAHSVFAEQLAGRAALWQIAVAAWPQQPLFGFGPGTFQAVIHANLGKAHFSTFDEFTTLYQLQGGGFHNLWLSVLVERGAIGFAGVFASWCLLIGLALHRAGAATGPQRLVLFTLLISLFLRGQVELAGLFDDGDGPINELILIALGLSLPDIPLPAPRPGSRARDLTARAAAAAPAR